ncbi:MAG: hypothetical protein AAF663_10305 [Planctomycetota bacterium]
MGTSDDLLRALNPAVRPVGPATPTRGSTTPVPFEQQSFDELLTAFGQSQPQEQPTPNAGTPVAESTDAAEPPATLDLTRIENASLRTLIAQRHEADAQ